MRLLRSCAECGRSRTHARDEPRDRESTNPILQSLRRRLIPFDDGSIRIFYSAAWECVALLNDGLIRHVIRFNYVRRWNVEDRER